MSLSLQLYYFLRYIYILFPRIQPQVDSSQLPSLACVIDKYWIQHGQKQIDIASNVRVIEQNIWLCHNKGITVFDANLRQLRRVKMSDDARDVALMADGKLVVGASNGLYEYEASEDGEYIYL